MVLIVSNRGLACIPDVEAGTIYSGNDPQFLKRKINDTWERMLNEDPNTNLAIKTTIDVALSHNRQLVSLDAESQGRLAMIRKVFEDKQKTFE